MPVSYRYILGWYQVVDRWVCTGMVFNEKYIVVHTSIYWDILLIKFHTGTYQYVLDDGDIFLLFRLFPTFP